jgi:hypothetical protein
LRPIEERRENYSPNFRWEGIPILCILGEDTYTLNFRRGDLYFAFEVRIPILCILGENTYTLHFRREYLYFAF